MGYALWTFLHLPDESVVRYPRSHYDRFFDRKAPLRHAVAGARDVANAISLGMPGEEQTDVVRLPLQGPGV
jgi:hypothetical protein